MQQRRVKTLQPHALAPQRLPDLRVARNQIRLVAAVPEDRARAGFANQCPERFQRRPSAEDQSGTARTEIGVQGGE